LAGGITAQVVLWNWLGPTDAAEAAAERALR
jgi:hypothetical protein